MPIYKHKCSPCDKTFEAFSRRISSDPKPCPSCAVPASKVVAQPAFVPLEGDLTYVAVRDRMKHGLYHDQDQATTRKVKENSEVMKDRNTKTMAKQGLTEVSDTYNRKDDY